MINKLHRPYAGSMIEPSNHEKLFHLIDLPRRENALMKLRLRLDKTRLDIEETLLNTGITREMLRIYSEQGMSREQQDGVLEMAGMLLIVRERLAGEEG